MHDPIQVIVFAMLAGGIIGFAVAVIFMTSQRRYLEDKALELRKAARRLEIANKMENRYLADSHGYF